MEEEGTTRGPYLPSPQLSLLTSGYKVVVLLVVDVGLWGYVCCGGGMVGRAGVLKSSLSLVSSSLCS